MYWPDCSAALLLACSRSPCFKISAETYILAIGWYVLISKEINIKYQPIPHSQQHKQCSDTTTDMNRYRLIFHIFSWKWNHSDISQLFLKPTVKLTFNPEDIKGIFGCTQYRNGHGNFGRLDDYPICSICGLMSHEYRKLVMKLMSLHLFPNPILLIIIDNSDPKFYPWIF